MSSTPLAGRAAGTWRIEVDGADRSDHLRILPHRRHDAAHELVPADRALVGDVMDSAPPLDGEPAQHRRQIGGERRAPALVVDERQRVALGGEAQHRAHHVRTVLAAHPRRAHDRRVRAGRALAGELRPAVHGQRVRGVAFVVRTVERPVEHVVGADREQVGADEFARLAYPSHRVGVGGERPVRIALAVVDRGPRRAVDHDVGSDRGDGRAATSDRTVTSSSA